MRLSLDKASFFVYICKVFGACGACVVPEIQLVAADPKIEIRLCAGFRRSLTYCLVI